MANQPILIRQLPLELAQGPDRVQVADQEAGPDLQAAAVHTTATRSIRALMVAVITSIAAETKPTLMQVNVIVENQHFNTVTETVTAP